MPTIRAAVTTAPHSRRLLAGLVAGILTLALAVPAAAQQQLATIQGSVADQSRAMLPGVTVTVTNVDTGLVRTAVTNESGVYRVPSLEPGRYEVTAELADFRKVVREGVTLSVGGTLGLNFTLEPGAVTETIQVDAVAPDIQTERGEVSAVVDRRQIVDLPLVGRNVLSLAALQPGVIGIPGQADFLSPEQGLGIQASGQRESGNNTMLDGMSLNGGPWGGTVLLVPNVEAVQEFQIIANNPSAEYGRNSGAAVSIVTKGGTNELSGSLFEFHRNKSLRGRTHFERVKPEFDRNDYGFSLGGPIRRNQTFFFASFEGVRQTSGSGAVFTVETQQFRDFVVNTRPDSIAAQLLQRYPLPMYPTEGLRDLGSPAPGANQMGPPDGIPDVGTINYSITGRREGEQFNGRIDQVFRGGNDRLRATYYLTRIEDTTTYLRPLFDHGFPHRNQFFSTGYTSILSERTLNEASFGYVRMHGEAGDPTPETPTISITGLSDRTGFGVEFWHPITFTQNNFEFKNTLTTTRGAHSLRFGGELRMSFDDSELHHWERPVYNFTNILDFADDEPFSENRAVDPATGRSTIAVGKYRSREWALFVQDNWKLRSNLTINAGLRYENFGNPRKTTPFNGIILGEGSTRQEQIATARAASVDRLYDTDWNNFGPRAGFAWDTKGDARFVIRGGAGISYNRINNTVFSDERLNPPQFASAFATIQDGIPLLYTLGPGYPENPALGRGLDDLGGIRGARVNLRVVDPDVTMPYSYNWFLGAQRELPARFVVDVNYIGSAGRNLMSFDGPGGEDYNRFAGDLLDGRRDRLNPSFAQVGLAESRISSGYQGMTAQVSRRFAQGFSFQTAYTLGRAKDTPGSAVEVTRPDLDYGPADYDIRHKVAVNAIWQIPYAPANRALNYALGGWQVNVITIWQSGSPFSVSCGLPYPECDFNADGVNNDRPNAPASVDLNGVSRDEWLAGALLAADFSLPAQGTFGTLGRNAFHGPAYFNTDVSLFKTLAFGAIGGWRPSLQLRVETFNLFDATHLRNPQAQINDTLFGQVTGIRGGTAPRVIQLGAKLLF